MMTLQNYHDTTSPIKMIKYLDVRVYLIVILENAFNISNTWKFLSLVLKMLETLFRTTFKRTLNLLL